MSTAKKIRTVLTGAEGAIGTVLEHKLRKADHDVWAISRRSGYDLTNEGTRAWLASRPCELLIHAAATPYDRDAQPFDILRNDIEATLGALHVGIKSDDGFKPPHFVLLSSITVYEHVQGQAFDRVLPLREESVETAPPPDHPIGFAKILAERAVQAWSNRTGGTYTIWRLSNVISPFEPHDKPGHVITDLYRKLFEDRVPEIDLGTAGFHQRSFSWVGEIADAIIRHAFDPAARNRTFNLGSSEPTSIVELAKALIDAGHRTGLLPESYKPVIAFNSAGVHGGQVIRIPDITRARTNLGWDPKATLADMVETFVQYKSGLADADNTPIPLHFVAPSRTP